MERMEYHCGDEVLLLAYRGEKLRRRVWQDFGRGVAICSEASYQEAIRTGIEPLCVGWPREDVLELLHRKARPPALGRAEGEQGEGQ